MNLEEILYKDDEVVLGFTTLTLIFLVIELKVKFCLYHKHKICKVIF